MNIVYVAPRFHTNQVPIIKHLKECGHNVHFLSYRIGITEDYNVIMPLLIKPDLFYKLVSKFFLFNKNYEEKERFYLSRLGFVPSLRHLTKLLKQTTPNIVIIRGSVDIATILVTSLCKLLSIPNVILYTQRAKYEIKEKMKPRERIYSYLEKIMLPRKEFTPVLYKDCLSDNTNTKDTKRVYIPFVMEYTGKKIERTYLPNGKIRIVDVGKFREYKNHIILLKALCLLTPSERSEFEVSIIGQASTDTERDNYNFLDSYIRDNDLENVVRLLTNVEYSQMPQIYLRNDVFILPSKRELASISLIEAMKYGLVCVSTSHNGTASYLPPNSSFIFKTDDEHSLANVLKEIISLKEKIKQFGKDTYDYASSHYNVQVYSEKLFEMCQ